MKKVTIPTDVFNTVMSYNGPPIGKMPNVPIKQYPYTFYVNNMAFVCNWDTKAYSLKNQSYDPHSK